MFVDSETFDAGKLYKNIPCLDVTSVYSEDKDLLIINVVNRHKEKAITADILSSSGSFRGNADITEINSSDIYADYTFDKQIQYIPVTKDIKTKVNEIKYSFHAHSFTQIKVKIYK